MQPINVYYRSNDDGQHLLKCGRFVSLRNRKLYIKRFVDWDWDTQTPRIAKKVINIHSDDIQFVRDDHETLHKCSTSTCSRWAPMWVAERTCPEHHILWEFGDVPFIQGGIQLPPHYVSYSNHYNHPNISRNFSTVINNTLTINPSHMTYEEIKQALGVDDNGNPTNP